MKQRLGWMAAICALTMFFAPSAYPAEAPDAWVRGLWIKMTGLPAGAVLEDATFAHHVPSFIYSFGKGPDNRLVPEGMIEAVAPAVTVNVERSASCTAYSQDEVIEKVFHLDKKALFVALHIPEEEAAQVKDVQFTDAPEKISEYLTYPCRMATFTDQKRKISHTVLFIHTDAEMFTVKVSQILRDDTCGYIPDKVYGAEDIEEWFLNLEMVEQ